MKKKKYIFVAVILIGVLAITGISYAIWQLTKIQEGVNVVNSTCFKIEFESHDDISLSNAYPIKDEEGMKLTPYTFTIRNICNTNATYQINLEELETTLKRLPNQYIKVSLNEGKGKLLNSFESVEKTISNADQAFKLTTGVLKSNEEKTFTLRLWMDYDTPAIESVMEATFEGKVSIIAVQKNTIPEVSIAAREYLDGITVDVSTIKNEKNEPLTYYYQINNESEIESEESTYTFTGLPDGKYVAKGRAETKDGIILEEKELDVTIAYEQVYISASGSDETGSGSKESPYASLNPAYQKVKSGGEMILLSDITATETANMNIENKEVTIRSEGENIYTILKDPTFTTQILDITNSNTVTTTNITFDGNEVISSGALIEAYDSTLNLNEGTIVQKNNNRGRYYKKYDNSGALGGGIHAYNSTLNIDRADIIYNKTSAQSGIWSHGAGIYLYDSILNLNAGTISYNENIGNEDIVQAGGGICAYQSSIKMLTGTISYNKTQSKVQCYGGGIYFSSFLRSATMNMMGGIISNNEVIKIPGGDSMWSQQGGGIHAHRDSGSSISVIVYITGGIVENNIAPSYSDFSSLSGAQIIDQR